MAKRASVIPGTLQRLGNLPQDWGLITTCTGSGTFEIALSCVADALGNFVPADCMKLFHVKELMASECEKWKQNLLSAHVITSRTSCLFADVTELGNADARYCVKHKTNCAVPSKGNAMALGSGFSCKSLSKLQNDGGLFKRAMIDKNQESSSYRTFAATLDLAESVAPLWLILENVDLGDCSNADSNGATISRLLSEAGFVTRDYDNDAFLLEDDDDTITAELERREKSKRDREKRRQQEQDEDDYDYLEAHMKGDKWKSLHMSLANSRGKLSIRTKLNIGFCQLEQT
ncbi:unnamed protein product [Durusdinium trenchii]|uniref:Uncharacterized protein n=1 Tax=Durusdinium trenchii TaxID=1381693 RepID=A0ABP0LKA7_9DINO